MKCFHLCIVIIQEQFVIKSVFNRVLISQPLVGSGNAITTEFTPDTYTPYSIILPFLSNGPPIYMTSLTDLKDNLMSTIGAQICESLL